ncbi:uncharacterized protein LOC126905042 [Daktulosphaira vitifoliae]|uniref:uncharacterized protein LOC126905042 n=1 Tax=Daktulosphaira vitifoliae TaxID=58002 RepID=UPI0021AA32EE|nr:uncharacterized protein LOC126905042 [Daktulosphaira vitifoliae]
MDAKFNSIVKSEKKENSYSIIPISTNEKPDVAEFLRKFFFCDEPLNVAIKLLEEKESTQKLEDYCIDYLRYGLTLMAVSQSGDIMGVILNNIMRREDCKINGNENGDETENCSKFKDIVVLLDKIKGEANLFTRYPNVNRVMEIKIVAVNEVYRGQGVCKALVDKTKELALKMECQMIYVECTSHFSAKAVERLGFQCIYSLAYQDYKNGQGEVVFSTHLPHTCAKVLVLPLLVERKSTDHLPTLFKDFNKNRKYLLFKDSTLNYSGKMEVSSKYLFNVEPITQSDRQEVISFLRKFFYRDEPLIIALNIMDDVEAMSKFEDYCNKLLNEELSLKAVNPNGDIIGVILNGIKCKLIKNDDDIEDNTKFQEIKSLLRKIDQEANVFGLYPNVCRLIEIDIVSVDFAYRGRGVCQALFEKTKDLAIKQKCSMIYVECSSYFSAKAAEKLGYHCIYTMFYKDYVNNKGEEIFKPPSPHNYSKVYVSPI